MIKLKIRFGVFGQHKNDFISFFGIRFYILIRFSFVSSEEERFEYDDKVEGV